MIFLYIKVLSNKCHDSNHTNIDFTFDQRRRKGMGKKGDVNPKSQKIHQNWTNSNKHQKSQVNGETEVTLHNQLLRSAAKANQF